MKKKLLFILSFAIAFICIFSLSLSERGASVFSQPAANAAVVAEGTVGDNITWVLDDTTLTVSGTGAIPDYFDRTAPWQEYSNDIYSLVVEDGITRIGEYAFYSMYITEVSLPDTLEEIGVSAFEGCLFVEIMLPDSLMIIDYKAFYSCSLTGEVTIPSSVRSLATDAFGYCWWITGFSVSPENEYFSSENGVIYKKDKSVLFVYPCGKEDESFEVPESVTFIDSYAFFSNHYLTSVTLTDNVTSVDNFAFYDCTSLEYVDLGKSVTELGWQAFAYCDNLSELHLSENLVTIGSEAFTDCPSLSNITFPDKLQTIDSYAFNDCTSLKYITLPDSLTHIGFAVFSGCEALEYVAIMNDACVIRDANAIPETAVIKGRANSTAEAFADENNREFIVITADGSFGDGLLWILDENGYLDVSGIGAMPEFGSAGDVPWYEYKNDILSVSVGYGVTSVGNYAFYQCSALEAAELADSVRTIGDFAFFDCAALVRVGTGSGSRLAAIGSNVFGGCGALEEITIPKGVGAIGANPFLRCTSLKNINVNENNNTYYSADGVLFEKRGDEIVLLCYPAAKEDSKYTVDNIVTAIAPSAFAYCDYIEQIKFGTGSALEEIGQAAFYECSALSSFTVPPNVTQIDGNVFVMCFKLEAIYVHPLNNSFFAFDGVLFDYDMTRLIAYPAGSEMTEYEVPFEVKTIEAEAFCHCPILETVTFAEGSSLTVIRDSAFYNSENISYISLPDALETIEAYAFMNCRSLGSVYIPENVTTIGSLAFAGCDSLTAIGILSRDCQTGKLYDAFVPATVYAYEDASFVPDLLLTAQVKYLADVPEGAFSFDGGILTINDITGVEGSEDPFVYPWTRWAGVTAVIQFNNSGTVATGLFSDFSLVSTIILNGTDIALEENACTGLVSLKTVVSFADTSLEDGALGGVGEYNLFIEEGRNYEGSRREMRFSFSDGTVSFISPSLSLCDYDFLDLITAVCYGYRNSTVSVIEFSFLEAVGFAFDSDFIIEEDEEVRTVYENIRIVPQVSYDAEQFEQISFNEFCENAANGEWVLLRLVTLDDSTDAPDEETSIQVTFSEVMNYILQAIIGFFNKILQLFKK